MSCEQRETASPKATSELLSAKLKQNKEACKQGLFVWIAVNFKVCVISVRVSVVLAEFEVDLSADLRLNIEKYLHMSTQ